MAKSYPISLLWFKFRHAVQINVSCLDSPSFGFRPWEALVLRGFCSTISVYDTVSISIEMLAMLSGSSYCQWGIWIECCNIQNDWTSAGQMNTNTVNWACFLFPHESRPIIFHNQNSELNICLNIAGQMPTSILYSHTLPTIISSKRNRKLYCPKQENVQKWRGEIPI